MSSQTPLKRKYLITARSLTKLSNSGIVCCPIMREGNRWWNTIEGKHRRSKTGESRRRIAVPQTLVFDKKRSGYGYKHFLRRVDILNFISLLPDWDELSKGLRAVILDHGNDEYDGSYYYSAGVVSICAWPRKQWIETDKEWYSRHQELLQRLYEQIIWQRYVETFGFPE